MIAGERQGSSWRLWAAEKRADEPTGRGNRPLREMRSSLDSGRAFKPSDEASNLYRSRYISSRPVQRGCPQPSDAAAPVPTDGQCRGWSMGHGRARTKGKRAPIAAPQTTSAKDAIAASGRRLAAAEQRQDITAPAVQSMKPSAMRKPAPRRSLAPRRTGAVQPAPPPSGRSRRRASPGWRGEDSASG